MKNTIPAKTEEAGKRLVNVLRKMATGYECKTGQILIVSPREISEYIDGKSSVQRIVAVAKAHPELVGYKAGYRKTYQGCMASRNAAGYYEAKIEYTV